MKDPVKDQARKDQLEMIARERIAIAFNQHCWRRFPMKSIFMLSTSGLSTGTQYVNRSGEDCYE